MKPATLTKADLARIVATEDDEQAAVCQWLDLRHVRHFAVPNGEVRASRVDRKGRRYCPAGQRLKKLGVKPGVPDLIIVNRPPALPDRIGTAVEMKRTIMGRLSREQEEWLEELRKEGWYCLVCYGAGEAIRELEKAGY